ncbi:MAG: ABC transporter ATP-binding protein [Deltaproteobacteria bacterium]|nr:ABC transporter ATP-binding protein [Deltaproteobacteria bacterium]
MTAVGDAEVAIELRSATKRYRDGEREHVVVREVSLRIERGRWVVVRGPSGSGKTTLLGLMGGLVRPTSGDVWLAGKSIVHLRDHHLAAHRRASVGMVMQDLGLLPGLSVVDNALLPLVPTGGARSEHLARVAELTARFGIADKRDVRVERMSGGERQRAALVRALVLDPPVVLLDEPSAHLDAERTAELVRLLGELRAGGKAVVVATHDERVAGAEGVDRVVTLKDGTTEAARAPGEGKE